jgi:hypothetical protein
MLETYATGVLAIVAMAVIWTGVQAAWRRAFPDGDEPDALAGRSSCHGCTCTGGCERRSAEGASPAAEGTR